MQVVTGMREAFEDDGFTMTGGETNQSVLADENALHGLLLVHGQLQRFFL